MASRSYSSYDQYSTPPFHLCFFLLTLLMFVSLSWYLSYESAFESFIDNTKLFIIVSPLLVLGAVHIFSTFTVADRHNRGMSFMLPLPEREYMQGGGGGGSSPWGVALVLVLLLLMVSYQSSIHERWFPLLSR